MHNKRAILWFGLIALIGVLGFFKYNQNNEVIVDPLAAATTPQSTNVALQQNSKFNSTVQDKETNKSKLQTDNLTPEQQNILTEIETRVFSDDAYVELASLGIQFGLCREEIDIFSLFIGQGSVYQQQQNLAETLEKTCEGYRNQYKNILSLSEKNLKNIFQPTSQLGRLLKVQSDQDLTQVEREKNTELTLLFALQENNSSLLMLSAFMYRYGGGNNEALRTLLKSNDTGYIGQMSQLAFSLLSCDYQNGQSCSSTSMIMVMICSQNPNSCGLDFRTWYDNNTLPGMKRDVDKLMAYYQ